MWKFIVVTFGVLGVMFYEMSGGADFVPEERPREVIAQAAPEPEVTAEDILSMADDPAPEPAISARDNGTVTLASASDIALEGVAARLAQPLISTDAAPALAFASLSVSPDGTPLAPPQETAPPTVDAAARDFRSVDVDALNVRGGPSTSDEVIGRLVRFEIVSVLEETEGGWSRILIEGDGIEGWVATRFLTR